jgi:hypothetical protein
MRARRQRAARREVLKETDGGQAQVSRCVAKPNQRQPRYQSTADQNERLRPMHPVSFGEPAGSRQAFNSSGRLPAAKSFIAKLNREYTIATLRKKFGE